MTFGERVMNSNVYQKSRERVITFGSLCSQGQPIGPVPEGYKSFVWSHSAWFMVREHAPVAKAAEPAFLFNAHGKDLFFKKRERFTLKDLLLSALWVDESAILIEAWERGIRRYSESLVLKRNIFIRPALGFASIDRVGLRGGGDHFAIQTITVVEETPKP
jgi:hypothetical protein